MPPTASNKLKGEWVELCFTLKALSLGMRVARPYGDPVAYDFIVDAAGRLSRVQVRSCWSKNRHWYAVNTGGGLHKLPYATSSVDFFVVYIPPHDAWYIIPSGVLRGRHKIAFFPHRPHSRGQWEPLRDRWDLLQGLACAGE